MNDPTGHDPYGPPPPGPRIPRRWLFGAIGTVAAVLAGTVGAVAAFGGDGAEPETRLAVTPSEPAEPAVTTPSSTPSASPDDDPGLPVYDGIRVTPADGWKRTRKERRVLVLTAPGKGAFTVNVATVGVEARTALPLVVDQLIRDDGLTAVRKGEVLTVKPTFSTIASQALMDYSGRIQLDSGVSVTINARCTTMTGVESDHEVTVTSCLTAVRSDWEAALEDSSGMFASVARSI